MDAKVHTVGVDRVGPLGPRLMQTERMRDMSEFRVLISIDNAAFDDGRDYELARILREVADKLENGVSAGNVRDANGNTVGDYGIRIDGTMP